MEAKTWKPTTYHPFKHWEVISAWVPTNLPGVLLFPCKRHSSFPGKKDGYKHSNYLLPYLNHHFFVHCEWVLDPFRLSQTVSFSSHMAHIHIFLVPKFKIAVNKVYLVQSFWCHICSPTSFLRLRRAALRKSLPSSWFLTDVAAALKAT